MYNLFCALLLKEILKNIFKYFKKQKIIEKIEKGLEKEKFIKPKRLRQVLF